MFHQQQYPFSSRPRRLRGNQNIRNLIKETLLHTDQLIYPLFIKHGHNVNIPIESMPGQHQWSPDNLEKEIHLIENLGIKSILLFGIPEHKDPLGKDSYSSLGIIQQAISQIKKITTNLSIITDVCFCEYTDHGHCGVINTKKNIADVDNDLTLALLAKQAVSHAQAGADIIAPSGMMDGAVAAIRSALDENNFQHIPILGYSVKYASSMYGPFRQAAEGAPKFGDRKTYQMDYANSEEAIKECSLDIQEGVDMLMVKPAHTYLDIIYKVKKEFPELPLGAYHTSGEYSMIKAAAEKGWIDEKQAVIEVLTSIRRAGADFIVTYFAKDVAQWLSERKFS